MGAPGVVVAFYRTEACWVRWRYRGGWRRLRGCLFRSLLSLFRYAALQGRGIKREI
jgi:hypothetical protein